MRTFPTLLLTAWMFTGSAVDTLSANPYQVGDIVEDFSLVRRDTREPMRLADFEGKIVFLDWFAWWCSFCQIAAPQVLEGVHHWYQARGGNPDGIEVVHVGVNLQGGQEVQTQNFIQRAGLELVLEDFDRRVANQFFQQGGQPLFVIINGVAGSPSHAPWELVYSRLGYGDRESPVADFRAAIDAIKKPSPPPVPPRFIQMTEHPEGGWILEFQTELGRTYAIESTSDLEQWTVEATVAAASVRETIRVEPVGNVSALYFRAVTQ